MQDRRKKEYVRVTAIHDFDGTCIPQEIELENGEKYHIDHIRSRCRAASTKAGGTGIRYTIVVCRQETFLFDEENGMWFVEGKCGR